MSMAEGEFNRGAVRPVECLREGWRLIKDDYWLFLGICLVGALIGHLAPMGILAGPMLCGIEICMLRRMRGLPVTFDMLFRGFDYFMPSFLVHLVILGITLGLLLLYYVGFFASFLIFVPAAQQGGPPEPIYIWLFVGVQVLLTLGMMIAAIAVATLFVFAFPLIVDREMSAMEAVRTSVRAVLGNLGGMFGLMFLSTLLSLAGVLCCYVGAIFVMPIAYAAIAIAYRQVFPIDPIYDEGDDPGDEVPERPLENAIPAPHAQLPPQPAPGGPPEEGIRPTDIQGTT